MISKGFRRERGGWWRWPCGLLTGFVVMTGCLALAGGLLWWFTAGRSHLALTPSTDTATSTPEALSGEGNGTDERGTLPEEASLARVPWLPEGARFRLGRGVVKDIAFTPDGTALIATGPLGVYLYDPLTLELKDFWGAPFPSGGSESSAEEMAIFPDGRYLAGVWWGKLVVQKMATGQIVRVIDLVGANGAYEVTGLAVSPEGDALAIRFSDGTIELWNPESWTPERYLWVEQAAGDSPSECFSGEFAFSPDGRRLLDVRSCREGNWPAEETTTYVWDLERETVAYQVNGGSLVAAFSPDGLWLLTDGGSDLNLWEAETGDFAEVLIRSSGTDTWPVGGAVFTPEGNTLLVNYNDGLVLWNVVERREAKVSQRSYEPARMVISPDGQVIALLALRGDIVIRDASLQGEERVLQGSGAYDYKHWCLFSQGGGRLLRMQDAFITAWDSATGEQIFRVESGDTWDWFGDFAFSRESQVIAAAVSDGSVKLWDATTGDFLNSLKDAGEPLVFALDGSSLATVDETGLVIQMWDATAGSIRDVFELDQALGLSTSPFAPGIFVHDVDISPDGRWLAAVVEVEEDGYVVLWDVHTGNAVHHQKLEEVQSWVRFSPDGSLLVSGQFSWEPGVYVWHVPDGEQILHLETEAGKEQVAFSPDSHLLAVALKGIVRLWDLESRAETMQLTAGPAGDLSSYASVIVFSQDGRWIAAGTQGGDVMLWDAGTGERANVLRGHGGTVESLAFSPDGTLLASYAVDGTVVLWELGQVLP